MPNTDRRDAKEIQRLGQAVERAGKERRKQVLCDRCMHIKSYVGSAHTPTYCDPTTHHDGMQTDDYNRMRATSNGPDGGAGGLASTSAGQQRAQRERAQAAGQRQKRVSNAAADKLRYSEQELQTKKWLDGRIREVAKREEAAERLAAEYQRRMALLKTKEDLEAARVRLFSGRQRRHGGVQGFGCGWRSSPRAQQQLVTVRDVISLAAAAAAARGGGGGGGGPGDPCGGGGGAAVGGGGGDAGGAGGADCGVQGAVLVGWIVDMLWCHDA